MKQWKNGNLISKTAYSLNGILSAFKTENAVRREFGVLLLLVIMAVWRGKDLKIILAVFLAGLFPLVVELINTAAETIIDLLLGPVYREDVMHAKDMLSAAVMISLFISYGTSLILIFW